MILMHFFKPKQLAAGVFITLFAIHFVAAQVPGPGPATDTVLSDWLMRLHEASRQNRAYVGTFVVSAGNTMSSARIWHVCEGNQQMERVVNLTGPARSTFRHNLQVVTFLPDTMVARAEKRESLGPFSQLLKTNAHSIAAYYQAHSLGVDRVAGLPAQVMQLQPRDALRYGYRVWTDDKTGLVLKLQTLDSTGKVLEQSAFSDLQLNAPVSMEKLAHMMAHTQGYRVENSELLKTSAQEQGWFLRSPVAGFTPMSCYKRPLPGGTARAPTTLQWVFSDGLATVSLFLEPYDRQRHHYESSASIGATQTLMRQIGDPASGHAWWLTAMGEVPQSTLGLFASALMHRP